jgi:hypothetical protein
MELRRTVYTTILNHNIKPHHLNRFDDSLNASFSSNSILRTLKPLKDAISDDQVINIEKDELIKLHVKLSLDSKKNEVIERLTAQKKFLELAGLKTTRNSRFIPLKKDHINPNFTLRNIFMVTGEFQITDLEAFSKAFAQGVGRRFSYGYGLIEVSNEG